MPEFFAKYRGKVAGNRDPQRLGRIQVEVPEVLGSGLASWAMPCVAYAGPQVAFFTVPPVGANVWVEFEGGNPDYPIWSGCFWGSGELPPEAKDPDTLLFKTIGVALTMCGTGASQGLTIEVGPPIAEQPLKLVIGKQGLTLSNPQHPVVTIELANNSQMALKISPQDIQLSGGATTLKLQAGELELANKPASVTLSASGVEVSCNPAAVKVASANVELSNGASSIKLSPASVNVNNGALEVM